MEMTSYNPTVLQEYADQLYTQARTIVAMTAVRYGFVGFVIIVGGLMAYRMIVSGSPVGSLGGANLPIALAFTCFAIVIGVYAGQRKSFYLKLQAQQLLCQKQIEFNTRGAKNERRV